MALAGLVGRDREMSQLRGAIDRLAEGRGGLVAVAGEAGGGKSALLEWAAGEARGAGVRVIWAEGTEGGGAPPYWPWVQVLRELPGPEIERAASSLLAARPDGDDTTPAARFALFDSVARAIGSAAAGPTLMILDDLHWFDGASLRLLESVAPALRRLPFLTCCATRTPQPEGDLAAVLGSLSRYGMERLDLMPLPAADALALVRALDSTASDEVAAGIYRSAAGNPFLTIEAARYRMHHPDGEGVPSTVRDVLTSETRRLPERARRVLGLLALWGLTIPDAVADKLPGGDTVGQLAWAGFVERAQGGVRFRHALVRDAIISTVDPATLPAVHAVLADAAAAAGPSFVSSLAEHGCRAREAWDPPRAFAAAVEAAGDAMRKLAFEPACDLFELAAMVEPLLGAKPAERLSFVLSRAEALRAAGRGIEADPLYDQAMRIGQEIGDYRATAAASLQYMLGHETLGHANAEVAARIETALDATPHEAHALRAHLLARLTWQMLPAGTMARRVSLGREAAQEARLSEDSGALAAALNALAWASPELPPAERLALTAQVIGYARDARDPDLELGGLLSTIFLALQAGDIAGARAAARAYERCLGRWPLPYHAWYVDLHRTTFAFIEGRPDDAAAALAEFEPLATGQPWLAALFALAQRWELAARRADSAALPGIADELAEMLAAVPFARGVEAAARAMAGDRPGTVRALTEFLAVLPGLARDEDFPNVVADAGRAAAELGLTEFAGPLLAELMPYRGLWVVIGNGAFCRGPISGVMSALARLCGDEEFSAQLWAEASAAMEQPGVEGLKFWTERLRPRGADHRGGHPAGLSGREVEVLVLLASGLSNAGIAERLTLSVRTVQRHVETIYTKTGAHNRAAATAFAIGHGLTTGNTAG